VNIIINSRLSIYGQRLSIDIALVETQESIETGQFVEFARECLNVGVTGTAPATCLRP
jgi:hypothetical protein